MSWQSRTRTSSSYWLFIMWVVVVCTSYLYFMLRSIV